MQCRTHPSHNGVNTCNQCGDWLCETCTIEINGRIFCRNCLAQLAGTPVPPKTPEPPRTPCCATRPRHVNWGLLLMFSCILPGLNYMYEGLIKRGLIALSAFFMLVYVSSLLGSAVFPFTIVILWITCFFDGFHIRRRINAGEMVNDDVNDIVCFVKRNKTLIVGFIVLIAALSVGQSLTFFGLRSVHWVGTISKRFSGLIPVAVIIIGLYVLFKKPKKHDDNHADS